MADRVCTNFIDSDGLDLGCHLVSKEYMLENYPELVPWMKAPGLWSWGYNIKGQLGNNSNASASSPVQTISNGTNWKQISTGYCNSAGIKTDGTLWMWGGGECGGLAIGFDSAARSSPVQTMSGGTNWRQVSTVNTYSISSPHAGAIKTDGTLWMWGFNLFGQLADNTSTEKFSPIQTVAGGNNWKQVSVGHIFTGAVKTDGTLWVWGYSSGGRAGTNTSTAVCIRSPIQTIAGGTNWKQISVGMCSTAAIKDDGTLWVWGKAFSGSNVSSPTQTVSGGTNWRKVCVGRETTVALKTDGSIWCWNSFSSPTQSTAFTGNNWRDVSIGQGCNSTIAPTIAGIKTDGTLWLIGSACFGKLGTNSLVSISSPVQTISGGTGWRQVAASARTTLAIRDEEEY